MPRQGAGRAAPQPPTQKHSAKRKQPSGAGPEEKGKGKAAGGGGAASASASASKKRPRRADLYEAPAARGTDDGGDLKGAPPALRAPPGRAPGR